MKNKYSKNRIHASLVALTLTAGTVLAGEVTPAPMAPAPAACDDVISGSFSSAFNSHFVSYGNDVWRDGSSLSDPTYNPSLSFDFKINDNWSFNTGVWADINDKISPSALGGQFQEIDLWFGVGYAIDKFSIATTYQSWNYASQTEHILDVKLAYDTFLSPSLTFHNRLDINDALGAKGTIAVLGFSHSIEAGPVTISFPLNFAYMMGENYYGGGADNGLAYSSLGVTASYPLTFLGSCYGEWSLDTGLTQYWTNNDVTLNNPKNEFLTWSAGLSASF
ncbi:MAG: hypothetical protein V4640_11210 [Verrucomicrobiota bacterium]